MSNLKLNYQMYAKMQKISDISRNMNYSHEIKVPTSNVNQEKEEIKKYEDIQNFTVNNSDVVLDSEDGVVRKK